MDLKDNPLLRERRQFDGTWVNSESPDTMPMDGPANDGIIVRTPTPGLNRSVGAITEHPDGSARKAIGQASHLDAHDNGPGR